MSALRYEWKDGAETHALEMIRVPGTADMRAFFIGAVPVTQALWVHVMGDNPSKCSGLTCPVENISWNRIREPGGFIDRINASHIPNALAPDADLKFRLPTEREWEYAARGGPHSGDNFRWSGSNDPDEVAWYGRRWNAMHDLWAKLFGWRMAWRMAHFYRGNKQLVRTHPVASKKPNQLGIYDMSGNVWEWCETEGPNSGERVLRGGSHHNWDLHCTSTWRYGITPDAHDQFLGFRLAI